VTSRKSPLESGAYPPRGLHPFIHIFFQHNIGGHALMWIRGEIVWRPFAFADPIYATALGDPKI
jgi:hypothetical protein